MVIGLWCYRVYDIGAGMGNKGVIVSRDIGL